MTLAMKLVIGFIIFSIACIFVMKKIDPDAWLGYLIWVVFVDIVVILIIAVHESWIPGVRVVY